MLTIWCLIRWSVHLVKTTDLGKFGQLHHRYWLVCDANYWDQYLPMITPTRGRYWSQHHGEWSLLDASQILEDRGWLWGSREDELDYHYQTHRYRLIYRAFWAVLGRSNLASQPTRKLCIAHGALIIQKYRNPPYHRQVDDPFTALDNFFDWRHLPEIPEILTQVDSWTGADLNLSDTLLKPAFKTTKNYY